MSEVPLYSALKLPLCFLSGFGSGAHDRESVDGGDAQRLGRWHRKETAQARPRVEMERFLSWSMLIL